jgi:hypothetical protein
VYGMILSSTVLYELHPPAASEVSRERFLLECSPPQTLLLFKVQVTSSIACTRAPFNFVVSSVTSSQQAQPLVEAELAY